MASTLAVSDYVELLAGGALAGGLLGIMGLALGAIIRAQVPTFVALFTWLLFIENVIVELRATHRLVPGALAQGIAGQNREGVLQTVWLAALLLVVYATGTLLVSVGATRRRTSPDPPSFRVWRWRSDYAVAQWTHEHGGRLATGWLREYSALVARRTPRSPSR